MTTRDKQLIALVFFSAVAVVYGLGLLAARGAA